MRLLTLFILTLLCTCVRAQTGEFEVHENGYIYPEATMTDLAFIVDSLDLKFKQCDLDRRYLAPAQAMASCYKVKNDDMEKVAERLRSLANDDGVNLDRAFPAAERTRRGILYESAGNARNPGKQWNLLPLNYGYSLTLKPEGESTIRISDQVYVAEGHEGTYIWMLDATPVVREIPETYARMIQYVDCMVDTTENIYRESAIEATGGYLADDKDQKAGKRMLKLVEKYPGKRPENIWDTKDDPTEEDYAKWHAETAAFEAAQLAWVVEQVDRDPNMRAALKRLKANVGNGYTVGDRAERYLEACGEHAVALESKRLRRVYGSCSQDNSPRLHAAQIARLSAAAVEWSVFLRAHLNIMNDRFDRASDGSYAYGQRGTYLGEIEALGIDAVGLLVGSCLEAEDLARNHYQSNWSRVGRALTEARDTDAVIAMLTDIIRDPNLDDLNRMTGVYLLRFMASNHGKEETDQRYTRALATAVAGLEAEWAKLVEVE